MPDLVRIVYSSRPTPLATRDRVERLVESAQAFNRSRGITGRLFAITDEDGQMIAFLQWIEGAPLAIEVCLRRIQRDPHHTSIRIAEEGPADTRSYPTWDMRYEVVPASRLNAVLADAGIECVVETDGTIVVV